MTWGCLLAAMFGLCAFVVACTALYQALVTDRDMERWRSFLDHPSNRGRGTRAPEDEDDWPRL